MNRIYLVTLAKATDNPLKPRYEEGGERKDEPKKDDKKEEKKDAKPIAVDLDGLKGRVVVLPVQPANYRHLVPAGTALYYTRQGSRDTAPQLQVFDLAARKETGLGPVG